MGRKYKYSATGSPYSEGITDEMFDLLRSKPKEVSKYLRQHLQLEKHNAQHWHVVVNVEGTSYNKDLIEVTLKRNTSEQLLFSINKNCPIPTVHYYNNCTCKSLLSLINGAILHDRLVHEIDDHLNRGSKIIRFISNNFQD